MDDLSRYALLGGVLFFASTLHSMVGFAFGLFAVPVLLLCGFQPYEAIVICNTSVIIHGLISVTRSVEKPAWRQILWMVAIGSAAQLIGVWILGRLISLDRAKVCQIFGVILVAVLVVKLVLHPEPRDHLPVGWGVLTMIASGIISGMSGMGGPPIVLWLTAHKWSNDRIRVTLWTMFAMLSFSNLSWQLYRFNGPAWHAAGLGLLLTPVMLLGRVPGTWAAARMTPTALRRGATAILVIVAGYSILQPYLLHSLHR